MKPWLAALHLNNVMNTNLLLATVCLAGIAFAQTSDLTQDSSSTHVDPSVQTSAKHDVGSGAGDIGKGIAKGLGSAAKGYGSWEI